MSKKTNFPSTAGITDNQTRVVLQAIIQHLRECSGEAGSNGGQYVTHDEMAKAIAAIQKSG